MSQDVLAVTQFSPHQILGTALAYQLFFSKKYDAINITTPLLLL